MTIYTKFYEVNDFKQLLSNNPGAIIVFLNASWCAPCKKIKPLMNYWFNIIESKTSNIVCCNLDVDANIKLYAMYKRYRKISGIPSILIYYPNTEILENNICISGPTIDDINKLFNGLLDKYSIVN